MPIVGDKTFPYTEEGIEEAREYAEMMGLPIKDAAPPSSGIVPSYDNVWKPMEFPVMANDPLPPLNFPTPPSQVKGSQRRAQAQPPQPKKELNQTQQQRMLDTIRKGKKKNVSPLQALLDSMHENLDAPIPAGMSLEGVLNPGE